jgi:hypothetical protein
MGALANAVRRRAPDGTNHTSPASLAPIPPLPWELREGMLEIRAYSGRSPASTTTRALWPCWIMTSVMERAWLSAASSDR